jgi:hypothetical protein
MKQFDSTIGIIAHATLQIQNSKLYLYILIKIQFGIFIQESNDTFKIYRSVKAVNLLGGKPFF